MPRELIVRPQQTPDALRAALAVVAPAGEHDRGARNSITGLRNPQSNRLQRERFSGPRKSERTLIPRQISL